MTSPSTRLDARPAAATAHPAIPDARDQVIPVAENLFKSLLVILLLLGSFYAAGRLGPMIDASTTLPPMAAAVIKWGAVGLLAIASGVLVTAMIALAHDAVHRVLFRSDFWNEFWGGMLSALSLVPFYANRQFHLTHHGYAHQPGLDPESAMHDHSFLFAATIGSFIGIKEQYQIFFSNCLRIANPRYTGRVLKDVFFVALAGTFYFALVPALGIPVVVSVLPMILIFPLVFSFRALSDHYGIPPTERDIKKRENIIDARAATWAPGSDRRQSEVSGWVVLTAPWLEWLWSHVNYHEVHHKYPYLSHRYMPQVFEATRERHPYLLVHGYWRSLLRLRRQGYYASSADVRPYLSTPGS